LKEKEHFRFNSTWILTMVSSLPWQIFFYFDNIPCQSKKAPLNMSLLDILKIKITVNIR